ncbi:MAG: hypothetical protein ACRCUY_09870 [Thermoguttaceae bacterium]
MEKIKQILAQLRDLFQSMTPGNRIVALLLVVTLLISLGYLIIGSVKPSDPATLNVFVYNGRVFGNDEQMAIENSLSGAGLKGHEWVGGKLQVPRSQMAKYQAQIAIDKAISPRGNARQETTKGFSPWQNAKAMDAQYLESTARDVEDSILMLPDIVSATVIPNKREEWNKNVWARQTVISVSVNVEANRFAPINDDTISAIGGLVAASFGIDPINAAKEIRIIDSRNSRFYNGKGEDLTGGGNNYLREQVKYQNKWKETIHSILPIPGLQIETTVQLKTFVNERVFSVEHDKPKAPIYSHDLKTDYEATGIARFGRPGLVAQGGEPLIDPTKGIDDRSRVKDTRNENEITNPLPGRETRYDILPLTPIYIGVTIQVPRDYVITKWREKQRFPATATDSANEEIAALPTLDELTAEETEVAEYIRKSVGGLLRQYRDPKSSDPYDMVTVAFYDPIREPVVLITQWEQFVKWLSQNWQNLSLMGIVLCGICVLWTISRPEKGNPIVIYEAPEIPIEVFEARAKSLAELDEMTAADEEEIARNLDPFNKSIRSLREEVAELVEENPDAAASVLRQWIGHIVPSNT